MAAELDIIFKRLAVVERRVALLISAEHLRWTDSTDRTDEERLRVRRVADLLDAEFATDFISTGLESEPVQPAGGTPAATPTP